MKPILVDTSVWIAFFRGDEAAKPLFPLLDLASVCINDLILAELLPSLRQRQEHRIIDRLESIRRLELRINWPQINDLQTLNLRNGINRVGIPDLIIVQQALQHELAIFSLDKHFALMQAVLGISLH